MRPDPEKLSHETLGEYFANPSRYPHLLGRNREFLVVVDSVDNRIQLHTPMDGSDAGSALHLKSLNLGLDDDDGKYVLTVQAGDYPEAAYSLAYAVYQGMSSGKSFRASLNSAVESFKELLARKQRLSDDQAAGLFGELLVLEHLMKTMGVDSAVNAWLGPRGEEHDFGLGGIQLEVKTTLSERRNHIINGANQLQSREGAPLWLLSIQLTRVGVGSGRSLDDLFESSLRAAGCRSPELRKLIEGYGWRREDRGSYGTRLALRSRPRAYHVTSDFPALTENGIKEVIASAHLISDVKYRLDVTGLPHGTPHDCIADFVEGN